MIIYKITNKINNKCYIGQTIKTLRIRKSQHIRNIKYKKYPLHKALYKYGLEDFSWEIICECKSREKLNEMECYYIDYYNSHVSKSGYNVALGGSGGESRYGEDNPQSQSYEITDPDKNIYIIKGLNNFCKKHNLNSGTMSTVARGKRKHYKNWRCEYISEELRTKANIRRRLIKNTINYSVTSPAGQLVIVGEHKEHTLGSFCTQHNLNLSSMMCVASGQRKQHKGWRCEYVDTNMKQQANIKRKNKFPTYKITHPDKTITILDFKSKDTLNSFCIKNKLHSSHMARVVKGEFKHHKGYVCEKL